ncbi:SNF2/RAD54 helicase family protein [Babesia gibsoni]|uniref:SNF2/RAD54 helicase family protein n=1 Tax=Babesia gibsoni TaxID=33632 RepID=A0AAD8UWH4_BABGI|nr:SNF2/RAD54 helicase family protein [Babesia gibsoni]
MIFAANNLLIRSKNRGSIIDDNSLDEPPSFSGHDRNSQSPAESQACDTQATPSDSDNNTGGSGDSQLKKKKKLKRQRSSSDSENEEEDKAAALAAEREAREELKRKKVLSNALESLNSFLAISRNMSEASVLRMSGGTTDGERMIRSEISHGSCTFISSYSNLDHFNIAQKFKSLKKYQQCGVHWLSILHSVEHANGILADEMGLGKTAQSCVFLSYLYNIEASDLDKDFIRRIKSECTGAKRRSSLILVPSSVLDNWCREIKRWAPNLKNHVVKYHGSPTVRFKIACDVLDDVSKGSFVILVSTMATVSSKEDVRLLRGLKEFEYMLVDEAHALKNSETIAYRRLNGSFNIRHRLLLTGTPVQNSQSELGNLLQFAMPDSFDQSKITVAINQLINHYDESIAEFPALSALLQREEAEVFKKAIATPPPKPRGRKPKKQLTAADVSSILLKDGENNVETNVSVVNGNCASGVVVEETLKEASLSTSVDYNQEVDTSAIVTVVKEDGVMNCDELSPHNKGTLTASDSEFETSEEKGSGIHPQIVVLQRLIAPFILRRRKRTVMHELPKKTTYVVRCKMTGIQQEIYMKEVEAKVEQNRDVLVSKYKVPEREVVNICTGKSKDDDLARRDDFFIKSLVFRMRRICNHPLLVPGSFYKEELLQKLIKYYATKVVGFKENPYDKVEKEIRGWSDFELHKSLESLLSFEPRLQNYLIPKEEFMKSCKIVELFKIIERVKQEKRKALVFSQFTMYLDLLEACLAHNMPHMVYLRLDGGYNPTSRTDAVERFTNDENVTLMLVSTKAGGTGLNLTVASTVVLMDQDWNPHNDAQAEDRCHRIGQTQQVDVYKLLCEGTIEEYIMECCQRKLILDDAFSGKLSEGEDEKTSI